MMSPKYQLIADIWQASSSAREAAEALDMTVASLKWEIWILRRQGYQLKRFERFTGRELPTPVSPERAVAYRECSAVGCGRS